MGINRRFLYLGTFLVAIGAVLVVADVTGVDEAAVLDWLRLWPLAVVAIGGGIILRRTRFNLASGVIAAVLPGLVLGGAFAAGPRIADCGAHDEPLTVITREGTFDGPSRVDVRTGCGSLVLTTAPGNRWLLNAGNTIEREPTIEATATSLSIGYGRSERWQGFATGRDAWHLTLPTSHIDDLALVVNAGEGDVDLTGADVGQLDVTTNAGQTTLDLADTSLASMSATVNAGQLSVALPSSADVTGSIVVNAGALDVCVPDGVGLRVRRTGDIGSTTYADEDQEAAVWQNPEFDSALHRTDLTVTVNLGSVNINPTGGCK